MPKPGEDGHTSLTVPDAAAWRQWLSEHHATSAGVWLVLGKKGTVHPTSLSLNDALEEALCYGWINGQGHTIDDATYIGRFTPRRAKSIWAKRNVDIVERLEREDRMTDAGRAVIDAAKADGRWQKAYAGPATAEAPADLLAAVAAEPSAQKTWDSITKQSRWMMYFQLNNLRTAAGRQKKIRSYVDMLVRGETPHPQMAGTKRPTPSSNQKTRHRKHIAKPEASATTVRSSTRTRSGRQVRPP